MKLNVSFRFSENHVIPVGTLCQNGRDSAFEYTRSFLAEKLNPAPFRLPVREGVNIFDWSGGMETFGMFEYSLPDGWGRRLVDVMFRKRNGRFPTVLERLACVGSSGMGANPGADDLLRLADHVGMSSKDAKEVISMTKEACAGM